MLVAIAANVAQVVQLRTDLPLCCRAAAVSNGTPSLHSTLRHLNKELTQVQQNQQPHQMPAPTEGPLETSGADAGAKDTAHSKNSFSAGAADTSGVEDSGSDDDSEEEELREIR
jgi:hypothetical protein